MANQKKPPASKMIKKLGVFYGARLKRPNKGAAAEQEQKSRYIGLSKRQRTANARRDALDKSTSSSMKKATKITTPKEKSFVERRNKRLKTNTLLSSPTTTGIGPAKRKHENYAGLEVRDQVAKAARKDKKKRTGMKKQAAVRKRQAASNARKKKQRKKK